MVGELPAQPEFHPAEGQRLLYLTKGYAALVDEADYERFGAVKWTAWVCRRYGLVYGHRKVRLPNGKRRNLFLHRAITGAPEGTVVDHHNGVTLDNTRLNLRVTTQSHNIQNQWSYGVVGYRGVDRRIKADGSYRYQARMTWLGDEMYLGSFMTPEEAAEAYDRKALEIIGPFARTNLPREHYLPLDGLGRAPEGHPGVETIPF
jgi:hypothetical protein